jgi:hypothetical protein
MRRLLKLKTPVLAIILGAIAEVLTVALGLLARRTSSPDSPALAWLFLGWFHSLPEALVLSFMRAFKPFHDIQSIQAQITVTLLIVLFALLQWYMIFLASIGLFRRFYRKTA